MQKPLDPVQYLIKKLTTPEVKRFIIVGPPGCKRKEIALSLAEYLSEDLSLVCISVGDLLNKEISKKSEFGKQIVESRKTYSYVKDEIVTELVKGQIEALEKDEKSWIIEGYPRTRKQALALQKMGIILDKFLLLDVANSHSIEKVTKILKSEEAIVQFRDEVIGQYAENALTEYQIQIQGVKETCKGSIIEIDGNRPEGIILEEIVRTLKLSRSAGPRRPPRVFIMGPPGCGKTDHAKQLAQKFQLQYVKVKHIIKELIRTEGKSQRAKDLRERLNTGDTFPDELIIDLVRERLAKPDCKINGYILDGCPTTPEQILKLQELGISPSLVVALDQNDALTYHKLEHLRYDQIDGRFYHLQNDKVPPHIEKRLIQQSEHTYDVLKVRLEEYNNFLATVENEYSSHLIRINAGDESHRVFLNLCEAVEKPVNSVKQKGQTQNIHNIPTSEVSQTQKISKNVVNGIDYTFLAAAAPSNDVKKSVQQKSKTSKSNEKYINTKVSQGIPPKQRVDQEINKSGSRYEALQSNLKSKRRQQQSGSNLNIKENLYSPIGTTKNSGHNYQQIFNQTMIGAGLQNINLGLSERQYVDLSQTQNIDTKHFNGKNISSAQQSRAGFKTNEGHKGVQMYNDNQNFDFGCQLRMPASTKHATQKQVQDCKKVNTKNSFFGNPQLQEFMSNMNNVTASIQKPFLEQNITVNAKGANSSNNGSVKRQPLNSSSNNSVVPVLDMKKVSLKQIQNIMKQKAMSIRESNDQIINTNNQTNQRKPTETIPQNQLLNIADSALYKNLTQKLIKEQQQQQQVNNFSINPQQNLGVQSTSSSKFNVFKKQPTPQNKTQNTVLNQFDNQKRFFSNSKNKAQPGNTGQNVPITATNKNHKSFVFDLSNQQQQMRKSGIVNHKNSNGKKKLNLTGTLPKGLLSPTNNSKKPKHSDYFDSNNNGLTFEQVHNQNIGIGNQNVNTQRVIKKQQNGGVINIPQDQYQQNFNVHDKSTLDSANNMFNIEQYQQQIDQFNHMLINIENNDHQNATQQKEIIMKEFIAQHQQINNDYQPQVQNNNQRQRLNQTTKIDRIESFSPPIKSDTTFKNQQVKPQNHKSQVFSHAQQQIKRPSHQKTLTLPNAALCLLQNLQGEKNEKNDYQEDVKSNEYKSQKVLSSGQTPRVIRQKKCSLVDIPYQKSENITIRKKNTQQQQIKKKIQIQLDLSDDEIQMNNQPQGKETVDTYDFNQAQIDFDCQGNQNDVKLRTQKISDITRIINNDIKDSQKQERIVQKQNVLSNNQNFSPNQTNTKLNFFSGNKATQPQTTTSIQIHPQAKIHNIQLQPQTQSQVNVKFQSRRKQSVNSNASKTSSRVSPQYVHKPPQDEVSFPITAARALKLFMNHLTDYEKGEILDYKQIYYLGVGAKKIKGSPHQNYNSGYDDERGDYNVIMKDHIGFRWEVIEFLGKGSFGQAIKCFDHKTKEIVAVKLIRNKKKFQHQAGVELKILQHLKQNDPDDQYNIIRIKDYLVFRKHLVISFELFSINLYEFIKNNNFQGVSLSLIRRFAIQMLQALKYLREENIIHCDLKPENILLKFPDKSGIKIIDFGSSCFQGERIYTYIQSRFYRAPEIILGIPYTAAIDMWSFGCILVELFTGYPVFPGESEQEQLALIMELRDIPSEEVLNQSTRKKIFFDEETDEPLLAANSRGKLRLPASKTLQGVLKCQSPSFLDFIDKCLDWNPETRMTPIDALMHDWIIEGLPPKVLIHHQRILGVGTDDQSQSLKSQPHIRYQRSQPSQSTKSSVQNKLNKTCLIQPDLINQNVENGMLSKRGKSLNKTGMVVIDENEDMVDMDNGFFLQKKQSKPSKTKFDVDEDNFGDQEKSKTTNLADLLYDMKNERKKQVMDGPIGVKQKIKMFENTHDISKLKKNSFFSQNQIDEQLNYNDEDVEDEDDMDGILLPYDERDKQENGNNNNMSKKNKIPFSFLMHHYMKTNTGQQVVAKNPNVGFYKPQSKDVKLNNFIGAAGNNQNKMSLKKGFVNMSSNV